MVAIIVDTHSLEIAYSRSMAGVYQGGIQGREGTFFSFRFSRRLASQSKRRPTTDAEIDRKWAGKTVDKTRSRSRINGNEPEDQEQSAGAHCRSRKYIVVSWSMSWRTARRGETRTNQDFLNVGRGAGEAYWQVGFTSQPGGAVSQSACCARDGNGPLAVQARAMTGLSCGGVSQNEVIPERGGHCGFAAERGL